MIVLLNGPFGVGKTTTAHLLRRRLRGSLVFDPELVGRLVRLLGSGAVDYQEDPRWRRWTVAGVRLVRRATPRTLIVRAWRLAHVDRSVRALADPAFGAEVQTGGRTPDEVADAVIAALGSLQ